MDTLVVLPTGGGKSLCYQVPALLQPGLTVVVSPLISLMHDQVHALAARGIAADYLDSTLSVTEQHKRLTRIAHREITLLYVAPERLETADLITRLGHVHVGLLAIDEAHCISEWGHDFRPSYLRLREARAALGTPALIALTATATPNVRKDICAQLGLRKPEIIVAGFDRPNLRYAVLRATTEQAKTAAVLDTVRRTCGSIVVYGNTRAGVERLAVLLSNAGEPTAAYHAGRSDSARARAQAEFMSGRTRVIAATNAFGMGVDKPDVRLVLHHSMPGTLEAYYQEAGRAGRDGAPAKAVLLHAYADRFTHEFFIDSAWPDYQLLDMVHSALRSGKELPADAIASRIGKKPPPARIHASLRILKATGAVVETTPSPDRVNVRMVATPARIARELGGGESPALGLLRALWRSHRSRLATAIAVNVAELPPGLAGGAVAFPLLDFLQRKHLVVWSRAATTYRLADPRLPLHCIAPRTRIEQHRRYAQQKLRAMERYAFSSRCRRAELLRYFGETPRRSACGGCDNCGSRV
jgi:ATP-dependent DNA helicase RecQ